MNLRTVLAALMLLAIASSGVSVAADRPLLKLATPTGEINTWCLSSGFFMGPGFAPSGAQPNLDFERVLLSPSQAVVAVDNGELPIDDCVGLGTVAQAWKQGARNAIIVAVMGISPAYVLVGGKNIKKLDDFKGKNLGSNGLQTTATQAVVSILQRGANLQPEKDYAFVSVATGGARVAALMAGKVDGISSYPPYSYKLADDGFPSIAAERQFIPNYVQGTLVVNRDWAQKNRPVLVAILKSMLQTGRWLKDPAKKDEVTARLAQYMTMGTDKIGPDYARRIYADVVAVNGGVVPDAYGDRALFEATFNLLTERALLAKNEYPALDKLVDYSYLNQARRELGMREVKPL
jgi:ABC-type nitrate/sulfonate/bicarbonate transport system substrate-binding protein